MFASTLSTLVLNADFTPLDFFPLSTWGWKDAICAVMTDRVSPVAEYDFYAHSPSTKIKVPSVVALKEYVKPKFRAALTRNNLIRLRDKCCCAYCGQKYDFDDLTWDHVIPESRGGKRSWTNLIAACKTCNQRKDDRTPEEAKMPLLWRPYQPSKEELAKIDYGMHKRKIHSSWKDYLSYIEEEVAL